MIADSVLRAKVDGPDRRRGIALGKLEWEHREQQVLKTDAVECHSIIVLWQMKNYALYNTAKCA